MINWKVRIKNKYFWLSLIPALFMLVQVVLNVFNISYDFGVLTEELKAVINAVFVVLAIIGVVNDPTTSGISDSERAMSYDKPNEIKP